MILTIIMEEAYRQESQASWLGNWLASMSIRSTRQVNGVGSSGEQKRGDDST